MFERLSLVPNATGARHVRAGQILRVVEPHLVPTITRLQQNVRMHEVDGRPMRQTAPAAEVVADVGDLVVELRAVAGDALVAHAYLTGPAAQLHRPADDRQVSEIRFEPARVERLSKIERFVEELGTEAPADRIEELEYLAIAEMQRAKHGPSDIALLDIEAGDQYRRAVQVVNAWWNDYTPNAGGGGVCEERDELERTCHLFARICRRRGGNAGAAFGRFRRHPGVAWLHAQPKKHAGWPPATAFHMQAVLEAPLAS